MKIFNKILLFTIMCIALIFLFTNAYILNVSNESERLYRVEAERIALEISTTAYDNIDLSKYQCITNIEVLTDDSTSFFEGNNSDYLIKKINNKYYRFDYTLQSYEYRENIVMAINIVLGMMSSFIIMIMLFIKYKVLKPFDSLKDTPYELSKGNLTVPLKENKNKYFGKFIWGMDMLREAIEEQKQKELELQKEKKMLVLSISHDIKTPLSAIKLYSKALSKNLYNNTDKQHEIAQNINKKADEIENFVSQIIKASSEDFLQLEVFNSEFYLSDFIHNISNYYNEKLSLLHIDFNISKFSNCLLKGDINRSIEVLQNIIENAVKYGNGHSININISEEEGCCLITVANSGCLLSEHELPHIFDSFWRGSNVGNNRGSGLGLYICRELMLKMNGDIFAYSNDGFMKVTLVFQKA